MKKLIVCILCCLTANIYAQDTVKRSIMIGNLTERFMVLRSDKKIRQGSYKLFDSDDNMLALGKYNQGKRIDIWNFYTKGILVQQYDYTANKMLFNFPDNGNISCEVPDMNPGDTVMAPVKVGGYTAGFKLMEQYTEYFKNINRLAGTITLDHLITLDENGKMLAWMMRIKNGDLLQMKRISFAKLPNEAALFLPASVNGRKVGSTVIFREELTAMPGYSTMEITIEKKVRGSVSTQGSGSTTRTTVYTGPSPM